MGKNEIDKITGMIKGLPEGDRRELFKYIRDYYSKREHAREIPEKKESNWAQFAGVLTDEQVKRMLAVIKEGDYFCPLEHESNDQNSPDAVRCGKNILRLPVTITRDEDTGYFVAACPLLEGCVSQGKDRDEAIRNIMEASAGWIQIFYERVGGGEFGEHEIDIVLVDGKAYIYPKGNKQE